MLTRMFAYFTLVCYLVVGTVAVRFCLPESITLSFESSYFKLASGASVKMSAIEEISAPALSFNKIQIPQEKIVKKSRPIVVAKVDVKKEEVKEVMKSLQPNELPFHEPITLSKVEMNTELKTNLVALYQDFKFEETVVAEAEKVTDEVSTSMASTEVAEPEFFEYPTDTKKEATPVKEVLLAKNENTEKVETVKAESNEVEVQDVTDLMEPKTEAKSEAVAEAIEPEFFDYPAKMTTQEKTQAQVKIPKVAETIVNNVGYFDYSKANDDINKQVIPTTARMTTQSGGSKTTVPERNDGKNTGSSDTVPETKKSKTDAVRAPTTYPTSLLISAVGSDLKKLQDVQGFEVRFQDDLAETLEDFGSGEVRYEGVLNAPKMTRTLTLLKRGYIPTTTEVILEEGNGSVSIPMIEDETYNEAMAKYGNNGIVGALLVELDDETEVAKLDVPFGEVIKLNGDFKPTENEDFRYQLFVAVKAGNSMISYHRANGEVVTKIVHVHENELTYDANFYEDVVNEKVRLYEEDLLAKESSPLIVSGDQVKVFATNRTAKKVNNHTYKMNFGSSTLGGRRYIELNHQSEPVFVGIRENMNVTVPSENFMRHILSNVEGAKLGNRCLVQINLNKNAERFEIASESVAASLMTYSQVLDSNGKFYDSLSDKSEKIIIVGESQGSSELSSDAKINVKIIFHDGSTQFLSTYCSQNTYLVEQL